MIMIINNSIDSLISYFKFKQFGLVYKDNIGVFWISVIFSNYDCECTTNYESVCLDYLLTI